MDRTNALSADIRSVIAYVPRRQGSKILLPAEDVHGWQNKPPEVNGYLNDLQLLTFDPEEDHSQILWNHHDSVLLARVSH
jgi:hypothetical protein